MFCQVYFFVLLVIEFILYFECCEDSCDNYVYQEYQFNLVRILNMCW